MKNIVVYSNYTIQANQDKSKTYNEMLRLSIDSCRKHLQGEWEFQVWSGIVDNHQEVFKRNWVQTDDLWHSGHNVLFIDTDTVFLNDVNIFDVYNKFMLFNYTDPKCELNGRPYFNCGVRYFPRSMDKTLWEEYRLAYPNWPVDVWDYEQQQLNRMLWAPENDMTFEECYHPEIVYQTFAGLDAEMDAWNNGVHWLKAKIVHYHGSRGNDRLGLAQQMLTIRSTVC